MRIGIIPPATKTGESRYFRNLVEGIEKKAVNIDINILNNWALEIPTKRMFIGSFLITKIAESERLSILHNTDNLGPFLLKKKLHNLKTISTVHDIAPVILPQIHSPIMKFHFKNVLPILISNSNHIIAVSSSTKDDLLSYFKVDESKISVIYSGIDSSCFYRRDLKEEILIKYNIRGNYILYIGTDNTRKNLKNLLFSFFEIFNEIPHNLVLVGPINKQNIIKIINDYLNSDNSKSAILNRIILVGFVEQEDLPYIYSSASLFILPSLYEGFGFPPLEAMACEVPVIVSNNSSFPEVVKDAGLYLENPLDPKEISEKILCVLSDEKLQKDLIRKGLEISKKYSWDKTVEDTIAVYNKLSE